MIERYDPNAEMGYVEPEVTPQYADQFHGGPPEPVMEYVEPEWAAMPESGEAYAEAFEPVAGELVGGEAPAAAPKPKRRGKAHAVAWWSSMVATGAVLGLAIVGIMKFVNDPAEASGKDLKKAQAAAVTPVPTPATNQLAGLNFDFAYPGSFDQVRQIKDGSGTLEQYMLASKANYRHTIAVEVRKMQPGGMKEDASYRLRQMHPDDYKETMQKVNGGDQLSVMTKADKTEATMFWPHGDKLLTVAVTTTDTKDDVSAMLDTIEMSTKWHQ